MELYFYKGESITPVNFQTNSQEYERIEILLDKNTTLEEIVEIAKSNGYVSTIESTLFYYIADINVPEKIQYIRYGLDSGGIYNIHSKIRKSEYFKISEMLTSVDVNFHTIDQHSKIVFQIPAAMGSAGLPLATWAGTILTVWEMGQIGKSLFGFVSYKIKKRRVVKAALKIQAGMDARQVLVDDFFRLLAQRTHWSDKEIQRLSPKLKMNSFVVPVMELLQFQRLDHEKAWRRLDSHDAEDARLHFLDDPLKYIKEKSNS